MFDVQLMKSEKVIRDWILPGDIGDNFGQSTVYIIIDNPLH
jgi:hypothetical protein